MTIFIKLHLSIIAYNAEKVKRIKIATNLKRKYVHTFSLDKNLHKRESKPRIFFIWRIASPELFLSPSFTFFQSKCAFSAPFLRFSSVFAVRVNCTYRR